VDEGLRVDDLNIMFIDRNSTLRVYFPSTGNDSLIEIQP
jgi:hypothetical protein